MEVMLFYTAVSLYILLIFCTAECRPFDPTADSEASTLLLNLDEKTQANRSNVMMAVGLAVAITCVK
jgi:hypothetical protein